MTEPDDDFSGVLLELQPAPGFVPAQERQGLSTTRPRPSQRGQVWAMLKMPRDMST